MCPSSLVQLNAQEVDLIFAKAKAKGARRMNFEQVGGAELPMLVA